MNLQSEIEYVVDINPYKEGTFIAGTGQEIVAPKFLVDYCPSKVLLMNPVYKEEVEELLKKMSVNTEVLLLE